MMSPFVHSDVQDLAEQGDVASGEMASEALSDSDGGDQGAPPKKARLATRLKVEVDENGGALLAVWDATPQPTVLDKKTAMKCQCVMCMRSGKDCGCLPARWEHTDTSLV